MVNMTCPIIPDKPTDPKPFFQNGDINFKAHDVGWLVCGIMTLIATICSFWLIWKHLTYYTCPTQQRHIVRLLVMVPVYAIVSFMSYLFYKEALYYQTIRDCYEAVLVTSFFYLLLAYTGDTRAEQHAVFRSIKKITWVFPFGKWKYNPEGLHFLWLMKICVLQYAIVRPVCTFVAVGLQFFGLYCLASWMPWFGHVWCAVLISVSVSVAMYCLIQLYMPIRKLVDPYKPILKFLAVKTIVFLTFWQDTFLSFLVSFGAIKDSEYFTAEQIQAGINALLECFWMLLVGFIHIKAFTYLPYRPADKKRTTLRGKAALDCLDFRDWFWEMKDSTRYIAARFKGKDYTLAEDLRADRHRHLLNALGKERTANLELEMDLEKANLPSFWKDTPPLLSEEQAASYAMSNTSGSNQSQSGKAKILNQDSYTSPPQRRKYDRAGVASRNLPAGARNSRDRAQDHARHSAELQRLVAELDLQRGDDEDSFDKEMSGGMEKRESDATVFTRTSSSIKYGDDEDQHPELTQYHSGHQIVLANIPALEYDAASSDRHDGSKRSRKDLSAVQEGDEGETDSLANGHGMTHDGSGGKVVPGVGAFGIAGWLGWRSDAEPPRRNKSINRTSEGYVAPSEQQQIHRDSSMAPPERQGVDYLSPNYAYGADRHAPSNASDQGNSWWRSYWYRVSNTGSLREDSSHGHDVAGGMGDDPEDHAMDDDVVDAVAPLNVPPKLGQVAGGSWGQPSRSSLSLDAPVEERQSTPLHVDVDHSGQGHNKHDSGGSSSSNFSPDAESPLSKLIQTSRENLNTQNTQHDPQQIARQYNEQQQPQLPSYTQTSQIQSTKIPNATLVVQHSAGQPHPASRHPSILESSNHASVTPSDPTLSRQPTRSTNQLASTANLSSKSSSNYSSAVSRPPRSDQREIDSKQASKHPIIYKDAFETRSEERGVGDQGEMGPEAQGSVKSNQKVLPPAVGPKGKLFNLVLPSPLSPARFPYGQEGPASNVSAADQQRVEASQSVTPAAPLPFTISSTKELDANDRSSALKWASQPVKPLKPSETNTTTSEKVQKVPSNAIITVGGMSLSQIRAREKEENLKEAQKKEERAKEEANRAAVSKWEQARQSSIATGTRSTSLGAQQMKEMDRVFSEPKEQPNRSGRNDELKREVDGGKGRIQLPAPSRLPDVEDPFQAGVNAFQIGQNVVDARRSRRQSQPLSQERGREGDDGRRQSRERAVGAPSSGTAMTKSSIANTAFEVGSIVPRQAIYRASGGGPSGFVPFGGDQRRSLPPQHGLGQDRWRPPSQHYYPHPASRHQPPFDPRARPIQQQQQQHPQQSSSQWRSPLQDYYGKVRSQQQYQQQQSNRPPLYHIAPGSRSVQQQNSRQYHYQHSQPPQSQGQRQYQQQQSHFHTPPPPRGKAPPPPTKFHFEYLD